MPDLALFVTLLGLAAKDRQHLVLENIALRHQLAVHKRSAKRPNINDSDRIFWLTVTRMPEEWRQARIESPSIDGAGEVRCSERLGGMLK